MKCHQPTNFMGISYLLMCLSKLQLIVEGMWFIIDNDAEIKNILCKIFEYSS